MVHNTTFMKSKGTAYLLWFFLGGLGAHKFYLGKIGMGILYLFTFGIFGIGWFIDLFTLGSQVDNYNAIFMARTAMGAVGQQQNQSVVVNVTAPSAPAPAPNPHQSSSAEPHNSIDQAKN